MSGLQPLKAADAQRPGEACSLLSFWGSSHDWLDHLVVSMFLPCLEATLTSPYRLNRLHTLSLESGAAV